MPYEPKEGIDYIIDFYAVAGVEPDANDADIKKALNKQLSEYHPDRLVGLAPEFQARGERMAQILNKARAILAEPEKRSQYDEIRTEWTGPMSKTGDPIVTVNRMLQAEMSMKSAEELEAALVSDDERVDIHAKYSDSRLEFLEEMVEAAGETVPDKLRQQYEEALLEYDRNLSIKESQRGEILGLVDLSKRNYDASLTYGEDIVHEIESAKTVRLDELRAVALAATARKLELLSGEGVVPSKELVDPTTIQLPAYFDTIAEQVTGIAAKRQEVVEKRLANFQPEYPESALQTEPKELAVFGISNEGSLTWFTFMPDMENGSFDAVEMPEGVRSALDVQDYKAVIEKGLNIVVVPVMEQSTVMDVLNEAINKYVDRFYPETDSEIE